MSPRSFDRKPAIYFFKPKQENMREKFCFIWKAEWKMWYALVLFVKTEIMLSYIWKRFKWNVPSMFFFKISSAHWRKLKCSIVQLQKTVRGKKSFDDFISKVTTDFKVILIEWKKIHKLNINFALSQTTNLKRFFFLFK
jgi:hypothetical protein